MKKLELKTVYFPISDKYADNGHSESSEVITFTQEEYNKHIQELIKFTLNNAAEKAKINGYKKSVYSKKPRWKKMMENEEVDLFSYSVQYKPSKQSIKNTFKEIFNNFKI